MQWSCMFYSFYECLDSVYFQVLAPIYSNGPKKISSQVWVHVALNPDIKAQLVFGISSSSSSSMPNPMYVLREFSFKP